MIRKLVFSILILIVYIHSASSQAYHPSIDVSIPFKSETVMIDGQPTIHYELRIINFTEDSIQLRSIEVINCDDSVKVYSIEDAELKDRHMLIGVINTEIIPSGSSGIVYLDYALPKKTNMQFLHRISYETLGAEMNKRFTITGVALKVENKVPIVIGAPLRAGTWAAIYDPAWERGHRRVIYTIDGKASIPGRFAIDFIKLNDAGRYASENENITSNWFGYNEDVIAVSDGVVASTRDDFIESKTLSEHPKYSADKATGNYISIDIGDEKYAFYEHLKPGSIRVKPGQKVKKGDVIAALGFTGQSTGPHLHFHLANKNTPLGAEGIPYVFEKFKTIGIYQDFGKFGKEMWIPIENAAPSVNELPMSNSVIKF